MIDDGPGAVSVLWALFGLGYIILSCILCISVQSIFRTTEYLLCIEYSVRIIDSIQSAVN